MHQLSRDVETYKIPRGRVEANAFTTGVGENDSFGRANALDDLEMYGIKSVPERSALPNTGPRLISAHDSVIKVWVVPTNEELAIARYAKAFA